MGTLDALRTWNDRNPQSHYQDHADAGNISRDRADRIDRNVARRDRSPERVADDAGLPLTSIDQATVGDRLRRSAASARPHRTEPLFTVVRPKADRYVFVLIRDLTAIDAEAGHVAREWYDRNRETLSVDKGSDWINRLKAKIADVSRNPGRANVVETPAPSPKANVWAEWRKLAAELTGFGGNHGARFAVDTDEDAVNRTAFWWIVKHDGPNGTRYFIRQVIGGQGPVRVRISPEAMIAIANKIFAAGPRDAMLRYGREIGECGHCGRTLTNDESRAVGIGPRCRANKGW